MKSPVLDSKPWYKQLWPWIIISLPASAVIAGLSTLYIAIKNQDSLVKDDWYKDGKAINRRVEYDNNALALGIKAEMRIDDLTGDVSLTISYPNPESDRPEKLYLELIHPTLPEQDQAITLTHTQALRYHGNLQKTLTGKRHINLSNFLFSSGESNDEEASTIKKIWRLKSTTSFPLQQPLVLENLKSST